MKVHN